MQLLNPSKTRAIFGLKFATYINMDSNTAFIFLSILNIIVSFVIIPENNRLLSNTLQMSLFFTFFIIIIMPIMWILNKREEKIKMNELVRKESERLEQDLLSQQERKILKNKIWLNFEKLIISTYESSTINELLDGDICCHIDKKLPFEFQSSDSHIILKEIINMYNDEIRSNKFYKYYTFNLNKMLEILKLRKFELSDFVKDIDLIKPKKFEELVMNYYESIGRKAKVIGGSNDYSVDVVVYPDQFNKGKIIQCKKFNSNNKVDSSVVQMLNGALVIPEYKGFVTEIFTTSYLTNDAKILANKTNVNLIERDKALKLLSCFSSSVDDINLLKQIKEIDLNLKFGFFLRSDLKRNLFKESEKMNKLLKNIQYSKNETPQFRKSKYKNSFSNKRKFNKPRYLYT